MYELRGFIPQRRNVIYYRSNSQLLLRAMAMFAFTNGSTQIGIPGTAGNSVVCEDPDAIIPYLPARGGVILTDFDNQHFHTRRIR